MIPEGYEVVEGVDMATFKPREKHICLRWLRKTETKGGIALPQTRWRAGFMKAQVLSAGPGCDARLRPGVEVEFNGLCDKEWIGVQDPENRDTVFVCRMESIFGLIIRDAKGKAGLEMLREWIMVRPDIPPEESKGGVLRPAAAREREQRGHKAIWGTVLGAGEMVEGCSKGDHIAFDATTATALRLGDHNDEMVLIIDGETDLLMVEEKTAAAA